ncbi:hypothetical protein N0V85_004296 [Neurospora sp. IMI 360204]|nr:hypothetical protein N0V85_004296 [Neurospora sp. IMI 360204]
MCLQTPLTPARCRTCGSAKPIPDEQTLCTTAKELGIEFEDDYVNKCPNGVRTITVQQKADKELERRVKCLVCALGMVLEFCASRQDAFSRGKH